MPNKQAFFIESGGLALVVAYYTVFL